MMASPGCRALGSSGFARAVIPLSNFLHIALMIKGQFCYHTALCYLRFPCFVKRMGMCALPYNRGLGSWVNVESHSVDLRSDGSCPMEDVHMALKNSVCLDFHC